jgi:hypothetical protein
MCAGLCRLWRFVMAWRQSKPHTIHDNIIHDYVYYINNIIHDHVFHYVSRVLALRAGRHRGIEMAACSHLKKVRWPHARLSAEQRNLRASGHRSSCLEGRTGTR